MVFSRFRFISTYRTLFRVQIRFHTPGQSLLMLPIAECMGLVNASTLPRTHKVTEVTRTLFVFTVSFSKLSLIIQKLHHHQKLKLPTVPSES